MEDKDRFKNNVISLATYIVDINADAISRKVSLVDNTVLSLGASLVEKLDSQVMIEAFIKKTCAHWKEIKEHDEKYFLSRAFEFFTVVPEDIIRDMSALLMGKDSKGEYYVTRSVRNNIWKYLESFVKISLKYLSPDGKGFLSPQDYAKELERWQIKI